MWMVDCGLWMVDGGLWKEGSHHESLSASEVEGRLELEGLTLALLHERELVVVRESVDGEGVHL